MSIYRFADGYVFATAAGLGDADVAEVQKDFEHIDDFADVAEERNSQLRRWLSGDDQEVSELYGESWTILRFSTNLVRTAINDGRWMWESYLPICDEGCYQLTASAVIRRHSGSNSAGSRTPAQQVAIYRGLTHEEWVESKNALQKLIAAGEGWRLNPSGDEARGYEAMFGIMARATWNAARCCHGTQLAIPSAEAISAEAEKLIRRWELRRML